MFCKNCGKPTEGEEVLCKDCAAAIASAQMQEAVAPAEETVPVVADEAAAAPVVENTAPVVPPVAEETAPVAEAPAAEDVAPVEEPPVFAEVVTPPAPEADAPAFTVAPAEPPKKKKKKKLGLALGITGGVLAVLGVLTFFFWGWISSFFNRTFLPADKYMQKVETKAIEKNADKWAEGYEALLNAPLDTATNGDMDGNIHIDDDLLTMLQPYLPEEFGDGQWLSDIMLDADYTITDSAVQYAVGIGLGQERLLTVQAVIDLEEGILYITVPELNDKALHTEFDTEAFEQSMASSKQAQEILKAVIKSLPDKETFRNLIVDYVSLAIKELDQVEKEKAQIFVGTQSLNVTALTATIQQDDLYDALEAILTKAQTDPVIINFVNTLSANLKAAAPELEINFDSSTYMSAVADAIDSIQENRAYIDFSTSVAYTTYVDYQDNIVGRKLETVEAGVATELLHYYTIYSDKDNYAYELYIPGSEISPAVRISGTYTKQNDAISITCALEVDAQTYLTLEMKNLTENSGTIRIIPGKPLVDMILESADLDIPSALISNIALEMSFNETKITLDVQAGGESMLTIKLDAKKGVEEITTPTGSVNVENQFSLYQWVNNIDLDAYFEKLEKAGMPKEVVDMLEDMLNEYIREMM